MFRIRAVFLLSLVINILVTGYQEDRNVDGELEVLLKRLQERLEDEERGSELQDFERIFRGERQRFYQIINKALVVYRIARDYTKLSHFFV